MVGRCGVGGWMMRGFLVPANKESVAQMGVFRCGNPRGEKKQELFSGT